MAILTGSRVGVAVTAILAALGSVVYQRVTGDAAAIKALPTVWHPFTGNGRADIVFQDKLKYCEDVLFDHRQELAILSCDPGRSQWNTVMGTMYDPEPKGTLYLYNYATKSDLQPIELVGLPEGSDFHPLGINIYRHAQNPGRTRLFVVNHQRNGSTVDIFDLDYDNARATFYTSISDGDKQIISPNAIAPISYTSFYVTNDHRFIPRLNKILNTIETFTPLSLSWVTLVDFSSGAPVFSTAASNIGFANGVVLTPTGKEVIVASTTDIELLIYDRDPETNILTLREKIPLLFRPDNLTFDDGLDVNDETAFDKDGKFLRGLIVAGHPAALQLYRVSRDPDNNTAPSWIVEIRRGEEEDVAPRSATGAVKSAYTQRTLYQSNGEHFGTSSTGAVDFARGRMLVSGLYSKGMLEVSWEV